MEPSESVLSSPNISASLDELLDKNPLELTAEEKRELLRIYRNSFMEWAAAENAALKQGKKVKPSSGLSSKKKKKQVELSFDLKDLDLSKD